MPDKIYETYNPDGDDHVYSFNEETIRDIAADNGGYPVYTHYAHSFFTKKPRHKQVNTISSLVRLANAS